MSIVKADILTFVNESLQESFSGTDLDFEIQQCLDDMSKEDMLVDTDDSQDLENGDTTLDEPTGFRALVTITLTITSSGSEQFPLVALKQGHQEYRKLRHNDNTVGIPRWFSNFDKQFFLWRPPNQDFTSLIEFYKDHPQDIDNIEFDETKFKNTVYAGSTYYAALRRKKVSYIGIWRPIYEDAKAKDANSIPHIPRFVRGN